MRPIETFEFPEDKQALFKRARRLEVITILYIASAATALYITMGSSQAMRASFFEDVISIIPAIATAAVAKRMRCMLAPPVVCCAYSE